eukprot:693274-Amphidinium_carterae.1
MFALVCVLDTHIAAATYTYVRVKKGRRVAVDERNLTSAESHFLCALCDSLGALCDLLSVIVRGGCVLDLMIVVMTLPWLHLIEVLDLSGSDFLAWGGWEGGYPGPSRHAWPCGLPEGSALCSGAAGSSLMEALQLMLPRSMSYETEMHLHASRCDLWMLRITIWGV